MLTARASLISCLLISSAIQAAAEPLPVPPCGTQPQPAYSAALQHPAISVSHVTGWQPPACLGWNSGADVVVAVAGRTPPATADTQLERIGQISGLRGLRYWSVSDRRWRDLVADAAALDGPRGRGRPDFAAAELLPGRDFYFTQSDSRFSGETAYRLRVLERGPGRLVIGINNITAVKLLLVPLFSPGDLRATFFLDVRPDGEWDYYAAWGVRTSKLTSGHESSTVNRAVAMYRFLAGIPTDQEPPAARH